MSRAILDDDVSEEFRDYIYERTEGSPLALEEMLREAIDRGDIFPREDGWDRKPLDSASDSAGGGRGCVAASGPARRAESFGVECSSVLGRTFSYTALAAITDLANAAVRSALDELVKDQILEPDRSTGELPLPPCADTGSRV